jgi:TonB family protein
MSFSMSNTFGSFSRSTLLLLGFAGIITNSGHLMAQTAPNPSVDTSASSGVDQSAHYQILGVETLTDTEGINFGPYINQVIQTLSDTPRSAKTRAGFENEPTALLSFSIARDGKVTTLNLDESSNSAALDRAAWASISKLKALPPLPKEFTGTTLRLRVEYRITTIADKAS